MLGWSQAAAEVIIAQKRVRVAEEHRVQGSNLAAQRWSIVAACRER